MDDHFDGPNRAEDNINDDEEEYGHPGEDRSEDEIRQSEAMLYAGDERKSKTRKVSPRDSKRRMTAVMGALIIIFALIGIINLGGTAFQLIKAALNNDAKIEEYENFILPVMMFDPVPFEGVRSADQNMLLQTTMWATMMNNSFDKYAKDPETGFAIIPASEIDVQAAKLFGTDVKLQHQQFADGDFSYAYSSEKKEYYVPPDIHFLAYSPRIEKMTKNADSTVSLLVAYLPPQAVWSQALESRREDRKPDKYLEYVIMPTKDAFYLYAIRENEETMKLTQDLIMSRMAEMAS